MEALKRSRRESREGDRAQLEKLNYWIQYFRRAAVVLALWMIPFTVFALSIFISSERDFACRLWMRITFSCIHLFFTTSIVCHTAIKKELVPAKSSAGGRSSRKRSSGTGTPLSNRRSSGVGGGGGGGLRTPTGSFMASSASAHSYGGGRSRASSAGSDGGSQAVFLKPSKPPNQRRRSSANTRGSGSGSDTVLRTTGVAVQDMHVATVPLPHKG